MSKGSPPTPPAPPAAPGTSLAPVAESGADAGIIPLSRYRAQLSRARTRRRADEILDHPDPAQLVPELSVQELYYAIAEVGLNAATDLLALCTPTQIRGFVDLDAWKMDQFVPEKISHWFDSLMDLGPGPLARAVNRLDGEVVAMWLGRQVRIYDLEQEAPPDEPEGHYYPTPDSFYLLDVIVGGDAGKRVERFIDWLYRADLNFAKRVVMAARWEVPADLEEYAYRWRTGRMADMGYIDYYEALEIYRYLDPASVKLDEDSAERVAAKGDAGSGGDAEEIAVLPAQLLAQVEEGSFLGRTLARVDDARELARLSGALMHLMNRVMSADRVEPADLDGALAAMRRAAGWLGLGLELLGQGDPERAAKVLGEVALIRIFRVGFSVTLKLKRAADALVQEAWVQLVPGKSQPASLLDSPLGELVTAVRKERPEFPLALAPGRGNSEADPKALGSRPFASLVEVALAARGLEEAALIGEVVRRGLGVEPRLVSGEARAQLSTQPESITFSAIAATVAANLLLGRPAALVPLSRADLTALADRVIEAGRLRPTARLTIERGLQARLVEREYTLPPTWAREWDRWVAGWIGHLEESLLIAGHHPEAVALLVARPPSPA